MERRLLCGDTTEDALGEAWREIPPDQAQYFMRSFLQSRGYHYPKFRTEGENLYVDPGTESTLSEMVIHGAPLEWKIPRKREIIGRTLTPKLLDELQGWAQLEVRDAGYPCARSTSDADPDSGIVDLTIMPHERKRFLGLRDVRPLGVDPIILDRYTAFYTGEWYSESLVRLSQSRIQEDGIAQAITLTAHCVPEGAWVERDAILGLPRQVQVGFGASTEEGAKVRASARQFQIGRNGSTAEINLLATFRLQQLDANFRWYYSNIYRASYLQPTVTTDHDLEPAYEARNTSVTLFHGWGHELRSGHFSILAGPSWQQSFLTQSFGPATSTTVLAEIHSTWQSHDYEFNHTSPRAGSMLDLSSYTTIQNWGADFTGQRLRVSGEYLWNTFDFDPPLVILATRFSVGSVFLQNNAPPSSLPLKFLFFAGGNSDLRGFSRQSLPLSGSGALSELLGSFEARFYRLIYRRIDPFIFLDAGEIGAENFALQSPIFYSPGLGLRWESPVGIFRAFAAEPLVKEAPAGFSPIEKKWRFALAYGEEF